MVLGQPGVCGASDENWRESVEKGAPFQLPIKPGEPRAWGKRSTQNTKGGLTQAGLTIKELQELTGSDEKKVAMAVKIWEQTTMNMKWIADHLGMKSAANASQQVRRHRMLFPSA